MSSNRPEAAHQILSLMQMQQGIGGDEHEVEGAAQIEGPHVALPPFHRYTALVRLTLTLSQHV